MSQKLAIFPTVHNGIHTTEKLQKNSIVHILLMRLFDVFWLIVQTTAASLMPTALPMNISQL